LGVGGHERIRPPEREVCTGSPGVSKAVITSNEG
jgi:hypothetical protein